MPRRPEASDYFAPPVAARRGRLTDQERAERTMTSTFLQELIIGRDGLALLLGWQTLHVRPGMRAKGRWWTATTGTMAKWPDLTLVRERDRRLVFAELKTELEEPTEGQAAVLEILRSLAGQYVAPLRAPIAEGDRVDLRIDVCVWRPSDLRDPIEDSVIGRILR